MTAMAFEAAAAEWEPPPDDTFGRLGYEPNCKVRHEARQRGDLVLPEPCGQCPQELFHAATEFDLLFGGSSGGGKTKALTARRCGHASGTPASGSARSAAPSGS